MYFIKKPARKCPRAPNELTVENAAVPTGRLVWRCDLYVPEADEDARQGSTILTSKNALKKTVDRQQGLPCASSYEKVCKTP